jgi:hypothetical protein
VACPAVVRDDIVVTVDTGSGRQTVFVREFIDFTVAIGAIEITVNSLSE